MAQVSSHLIYSLCEKPTGTSSAYQPEFLYLLRYSRDYSSPILGLSFRAPAGDGTVAFVLVSNNKDGLADEILFKTELAVPSSADASGYATLVVTFPEPVNYHDNFWLGFRFSAPVELPIRAPWFPGERTAQKVDYAKLGGSLLGTPMVDLANDDKLGMPIMLPIYGEQDTGVQNGL